MLARTRTARTRRRAAGDSPLFVSRLPRRSICRIFCRFLLGNRAFAYSIEYPFPVEIVLVRVVAHTLTHGDGGLFHRVCGVHIHHTNILFREDYRRVVLVFLNFFLRLKYQKNMAPKKSKVKKRVAQPAKSIIERTICAHPMLKRVQKEVRELKKKSAKKHKK